MAGAPFKPAFGLSGVFGTPRKNAKGRILLRELALSDPIFRRSGVFGDQITTLSSLPAWELRAEPAPPSAFRSFNVVLAFRLPAGFGCPNRVSLPILPAGFCSTFSSERFLFR